MISERAQNFLSRLFGEGPKLGHNLANFIRIANAKFNEKVIIITINYE